MTFVENSPTLAVLRLMTSNVPELQQRAFAGNVHHAYIVF